MRDGEDQLRASITEHFVSEIEELRRDASRCGFERLAQSLELAAQMARFTIEERKRVHEVEKWRESHG